VRYVPEFPVENRAVGSLLAYIELNPVGVGLCHEAGEFRWSSVGVHLGIPGDQAGSTTQEAGAALGRTTKEQGVGSVARAQEMFG